jgi:hypothetical protein
MTDEQYKELMAQVGMPNSRITLGALRQVTNETARELLAARAVERAAKEIERLWVEQQPEAWLYEVGGARYYHLYRYDHLYTTDGGETFVKGVPLYRKPPRDEEIQRLKGQIDALLAHCPVSECPECAEIVCPHGEPMHFHHDGCPACAHFDGEAP